jgi:alpha-beta hydrolase superfamily lysophospholipase
VLIGAAAAVFVAVNIVAYLHARAMLRFSDATAKTKNPERLGTAHKLRVLLTGIDNPRPADAATPAAYALPFESRRIASSAGVTLGAWLIPHPAPVGCAVLLHGYTASKAQLLAEAAELNARGYAALLVDFRGSAESSERYTTVGYAEADDVKAAIDYAVRELNFPAPIVYAKSMGAAAFLRAIAVYDLPVRAVVLESVFDRMVSTVKQRFYSMGIPATPLTPVAELLVLWGGVQFGFWAFAHNPIDYARACRIPVLMLHGTEDPRATLAQARSVFDALPGSKTLVDFPGAGHEALLQVDRTRWTNALDTFLTSLRDSRE